MAPLKLGLLALLFPCAALADGVYLDSAFGFAQGLVQDIHHDAENPVTWSPAFHAQVELGYKFGRWELFVQHTSSPLTSRDQGMDMIGLRHRLVGKP